jgi:hypothetical protein
VTANARAFRVMVRNAAFRRVELAARGDVDGLAGAESPGGWDRAAWTEALAAYAAEHERAEIGTGADARGGAWFKLEEGSQAWVVRQVIDDPEGHHDWVLTAEIDLAASDAEGAPVWRTTALGTTPAP